LEFLDRWIRDGAPNVYWISGFFFTQSFLTGVMQNYARRFQVPIDAVGFEYEVMATDGNDDAPPDIGAYCNVCIIFCDSLLAIIKNYLFF
jgi:dynein heavy chain